VHSCCGISQFNNANAGPVLVLSQFFMLILFLGSILSLAGGAGYRNLAFVNSINSCDLFLEYVYDFDSINNSFGLHHCFVTAV